MFEVSLTVFVANAKSVISCGKNLKQAAVRSCQRYSVDLDIGRYLTDIAGAFVYAARFASEINLKGGDRWLC